MPSDNICGFTGGEMPFFVKYYQLFIQNSYGGKVISLDFAVLGQCFDRVREPE
jgi:hypothetical protein